MKLPWVSREQYEDMRASRDDERENAQELRRELVSALRPAVGLTPAGSIAYEPIVALPDPVRDVIREQAEQDGRLDHQLASHFRKLARQMKRDGKTDDEIIGALVQWQTSEGSA
jgi:hypothetical protein